MLVKYYPQYEIWVSESAMQPNLFVLIAKLFLTIRDSAARYFGGNQIHPMYRNRLPLPVLAARLHHNHSYTCCEEMHAGGEGHCEKDIIIAWVAGLDIGDTADRLRCSIQVRSIPSEYDSRRTYKYLKDK